MKIFKFVFLLLVWFRLLENQHFFCLKSEFGEWYNLLITNYNPMNSQITFSTIAFALCACTNTYAANKIDISPLLQEEKFDVHTKQINCNMPNGSRDLMMLRQVYNKETGVPVYKGNGVYAALSYTDVKGIYHSKEEVLATTSSEYTNDGWEVVVPCGGSQFDGYTSGTDKVVGDWCPSGYTTGGFDRIRKYLYFPNMPAYKKVNFKINWQCTELASFTLTETGTDFCPYPKTGMISKSRKIKAYTDGYSYALTDWVVTSNSCVTPPPPVPVVTTTQKVVEVSCDSFYKAPAGTYSGKVYQTGILTTSKNFLGIASSVFTVESQDISSCAQMFSDVIESKMVENCTDGQSGTITKAVYTAKDSSGKTTYPLGQSPVILLSNCATVAEIDKPQSANIVSAKSAVLSNMSFLLSQLSSNGSELAKAISEFDSSLASDPHTLNIVADTMNANTLNTVNVTKVVRAFKKASGNNAVNIKIGAISRNLIDYVGQNGLTVDKISKEKLILMNANESDGVVTVEYASFLNQMRPSYKQKFTVKLFDL
ncbi:hypothetical protein ALP52_00862 [Pseudomonas amygdali pv. mori]|uniref:Uncharacterized protein n=1 Tax=Pseudomonas amygdali pv. mori TaxID=34065 RepID=A0A3M5IN36_PSEA0|nr:hypothetical protein [Pseudomonas amygdali]RMT12429.1 hypothetical protein ALP52_00862 [Pseudomonas amygdali pv. mori]